MIDWYRLPWKDVRGLVLILAMSNSPNNLTAGYLIELSLSSFGDVSIALVKRILCLSSTKYFLLFLLTGYQIIARILEYVENTDRIKFVR